MIQTIMAIFIGGIVTFIVAMIYYKKASRELKEEANELRRLNRYMLQGLENAGWIELQRDKDGKVVGFGKTMGGEAKFKGDLKTDKNPK